MAVYCSSCGKANTDQATNCASCGQQIKEGASKTGGRKFKGTMIMANPSVPPEVRAKLKKSSAPPATKPSTPPAPTKKAIESAAPPKPGSIRPRAHKKTMVGVPAMFGPGATGTPKAVSAPAPESSASMPAPEPIPEEQPAGFENIGTPVASLYPPSEGPGGISDEMAAAARASAYAPAKSPATPKKRSRTSFKWFLAVVVVALLAVGAFWFMRG